MYLAQITRYDIMYSSGQLARAMSKPSKVHMGAAKHLLRYLAGTTNLTIVYTQGGFKLSLLRPQLGQQPRQPQINVVLHHGIVQGSSQL